ncbi:MAG: ParB/RepB/Spo0J family partition protein, partial [Actinobacteria bacterium]|nr:ParB/RepB/Spo0J family partition protein [Actinomycetota bacterium]
MATAEKQTQKTAGGSADLRVVPIAAVSLREGFNPRTTRDNEAFARTAWSVRETGVLQPVLVTPAAGDGNAFEVVAGEGRYLAALKAGLEELPVIVRDVDERTGGLELALAENLAREELDPVAIAGGFARLKAAGWSKRQIAEELSVTQKLVTERLLILNIPEQLRPKIASGEIPLSAVRALARVGEIHEDLPAVLDARVSDGRPSNGWAEPLDWTDVVEDPIAALTATYTGEGTALPAEVYDAGEAYPVPDLPLTDDTMVQAREIADLQGIDLGGAKMRFAREALEQALSLKAAFPDERNYSHLIVGDDVAAQILGDQITAQLTQARKAAKDNPTPSTGNTGASSAEANGATPTDGTGTPSGARQDDEVSVVEVAEEKRRARAERQELQRAARAFNEDLGAAVLRSLVRLKIDERVLRVLIATDPLGDLGGLAMRGARYGLPGWTTEETTATGKTKVVFPTRRGCAEKAREFLQGASSVGEITGRVFALIVMARYADERAVADSNGAGYELREPTDRPWDDAL